MIESKCITEEEYDNDNSHNLPGGTDLTKERREKSTQYEEKGGQINQCMN